jgi:hypothetical protein
MNPDIAQANIGQTISNPQWFTKYAASQLGRAVRQTRSRSHPSHDRAVRTFEPAYAGRLLSVRSFMLPGLAIYGMLVDPLTGHGGIPCLWRLCFGLTCPGCGLSRADALLVHGSLQQAIAQNWLILPVWGAAIHSFIGSMYSFSTQRGNTNG